MPPKTTWKVKFDKRAEKLFSKLDKITRTRIKDFIDQKLVFDPILHSKMLVGNNKFFRSRVGDYRVVFEIKNQELIIIIIDIGHRREIYK
ncbi:MAG: type II toxin-antitoxin system RelE/ParE family toxin [Pseudomonadota bacterium]